MAGRLLVFKNSTQPIEGDAVAPGFDKLLRLDGVEFHANAFGHGSSGTGTVSQSGVTCHVPFGPWVADLQQRLYQGAELGDVEIADFEQKVDAENNKVWKKIRSITLQDASIETLNQTWVGIASTIQMRLEFDGMTFAANDKLAYFSKLDEAAK